MTIFSRCSINRSCRVVMIYLGALLQPLAIASDSEQKNLSPLEVLILVISYSGIPWM